MALSFSKARQNNGYYDHNQVLRIAAFHKLLVMIDSCSYNKDLKVVKIYNFCELLLDLVTA